MEDFIVSALKYRPATFRSVVGQKALTTTLKNAVITKKLAHAYLFCGPRGVGKTTCARIFAKTINCFTPTTEGEACNQCESCVSFNDQRSYNIHELDAASNNSVDDIRLLIEQVRIPPQIGQYKVYIIDEVHMLSTAAFNAFLKTLEEPPRHAIFVLATTEKHKILPTILSRCQIYDFSRISVNDTVEHLQHVAQEERVAAEPEALNIIAQKADGGMRDALSIFDQVVSFTGGNITYRSVIDNLNVLDYDYFFQLIDSFLVGNVSSSLLIYNQILNNGFEGQNFISGLSSHFRDLLVSKDPQTIVLLEVGEAIGKKYIAQAQQCHHQFLYKALELANECDLNYRTSKNKRLLVELTLIRLCQLLQPSQPLETQKTQLQPINAGNSTPPNGGSTVSPTPVQQVKPNLTQAAVVAAQMPSSFKVPPPTNTLPAEKTNTTLKSSFKMPGVSIKSSMEVKTQEVKNNIGQDYFEDSDYSQEQLLEAWNTFENEIPSERILIKKTLKASQPIYKDKRTFEVFVDTQAQIELLDAESNSLLGFLKRTLKNSYIKMEAKVNESLDRPKVFNNQERFMAMVKDNPELYRLKTVFNLEIV